jgi:hypothetical protein
MRRVALFLSVVALMLGGGLTLQTHSTAVAQDATPAASDAAFNPGSVNGEVRNSGTEHAEGLVILIAPAGMGAMASPAATPSS